ncbi:hypothetical protein OAG63_00255 [Methylacidiphilales bacterium]|nr:hypothetical protein [Candidatus Methylacidiphilales bacterium]
MLEEDRESTSKSWLVVFVLLSLLAHVVVILAVILVSLYVPAPKLDQPPQANPEVTLSLVPPPQPQQAHRPIFLATNPDPTAKPQDTPVESDNTTALKSRNQKARVPDSFMPDVTGKKNQPFDLQDTPFVPPTPNPQMASNQAVQKQSQQQSPPQPKQQMQAQQTPPQPPQPTPRPPEPTPPKPPAPQVVKNNFDPNGLPLLPPIAAPTLAPQTPVTTAQQVQNQTAARPPPSFQLNKSDVAGSQGAIGDNTAAANATELGRYKAKFYRAVGSRWYAKVGQQFQILPVGTVHIQYTIHSDGIVDNIRVLEGDNSALQILLSISQNSITEASPFDPFTEGMRKELIKTQGGDGSSYTDDFTFSIYGG